MSQYDEEILGVLKSIRQEISANKQLMQKLVEAMVHQAEAEIPEYMRRFANYFHDMHDVRYMYEEQGHDVPHHILRELERLDDRCRQLLQKLHAEGGAFSKVRREMAEDPENRWDHTRLLIKPKENISEAGQSE
jgi:hypothetical protein